MKNWKDHRLEIFSDVQAEQSRHDEKQEEFYSPIEENKATNNDNEISIGVKSKSKSEKNKKNEEICRFDSSQLTIDDLNFRIDVSFDIRSDWLKKQENSFRFSSFKRLTELFKDENVAFLRCAFTDLLQFDEFLGEEKRKNVEISLWRKFFIELFRFRKSNKFHRDKLEANRLRLSTCLLSEIRRPNLDLERRTFRFNENEEKTFSDEPGNDSFIREAARSIDSFIEK